ncbi:type II secretion system protein N [Pseudohongiella spirulinae]|uniref:Type II secretion system protein N n=1 Tax=Pseudohongiella spirulinae TaxID=1249552 RepID=A0A0S2KFY1_9GAMM|nr:type II secretion system protein N [Pseudohongiella spirulinae]ALO47022.1 hypothetical protein PS2015_2388 [Pseudohongiella spirulinae]
MRIRSLVLIVLLLSLAWIVWLAPATLLAMVSNRAGVHLVNLQGSIWQGQAALALIDGHGLRLQAQRLRWQVDPLSLLGGQLCMQFTAMLPAPALPVHGMDGRVCVGSHGRLSLTDTQLELPASQAIRESSMRVSGDISLEIQRLETDADQKLVALQGRGLWSDASMTVSSGYDSSRLIIGSAAIQLSTLDGLEMLITADNHHETDADLFELQISAPLRQPQNYAVQKLVLGEELITDTP